ncbi:hypothetical protein NQZ79_g1707 [Umbelopsis isabellina]|nr:hypothetical protein NQZ79_g1707 [Umbelopsis isabellina]
MKTPGQVACSCRWRGERGLSFRERCLSSIASHAQMGHGCVFMAIDLLLLDTCEWDNLGYFQFAEQLKRTCTGERSHISPSMSRVMARAWSLVSCFVNPMGQWTDSVLPLGPITSLWVPTPLLSGHPFFLEPYYSCWTVLARFQDF